MQHASTVNAPLPPATFPRSTRELVDTTLCPRCFAALENPVTCSRCGFPIADPAALDVHEYSVLAAEALGKRQALIDEMTGRAAAADAARRAEEQRLAARLEAERLAAAAAADRRTATVVEPVAALPVTALPVAAPPAAPPSLPPSAPPLVGPAAPAGPRRSSVQLVLLVSGIILLGVAAIVFVTIAWVVSGLEARAMITAGITIATIAIASWLLRFQLRATAEGIAALGALLVLLDAWAIRALDLFGAGAVGGALYTGVALLVSALVFEVWGRVSALRTPSIAAAFTVLPGVGYTVAGLTRTTLTDPERAAIGFATMALAALLQAGLSLAETSPTTTAHEALPAAVPAAPRRRIRSWRWVRRTATQSSRTFEIHLLAVVGVVSGLIAVLTGALAPVLDGETGPALPLAALLAAVACAAQGVLLGRRPIGAWTTVLRAAAFTVAIAALLVATRRLDGIGVDPDVTVAVTTATAIVLPAAADAVRRRWSSAFGAAGTAVVVAALIGLIVPLADLLASGGTAAAYLDVGFEVPPSFAERRAAFDAVSGTGVAAVLGAAVGVVLATAVVLWSRTLAERVVWLAGGAAFIALLGSFRTGDWMASTIAFVLLPLLYAAVLVAVHRFARHDETAWLRRTTPVAWIGLGVSIIVATVFTHASAPGGLVAGLAVVVALLAARSTVTSGIGDLRPDAIRAVLVGAVVVAAWFTSVDASVNWRSPGGPLEADALGVIVLGTGVLLTAVGAFDPARLATPVERLLLVLGGAAPAAVAAIGVAARADVSADWISLPALAVAFLVLLPAVAIAGEVHRRRATSTAIDRWCTGVLDVATAVGVAAAGYTLLRLATPESLRDAAVLTIAAAVSATAVAAWSFAARVRDTGRSGRTTRDVGAALLAVVATTSGWAHRVASVDEVAVGLVTATAAVAVGAVALFVASGHDGLARSSAPRRFIGWVALPSAVIAWWSFLDAWAPDAASEWRGLVTGLLIAGSGWYVRSRGRSGPYGTAGRVGARLVGVGLLAATFVSLGDVASDPSPLRAILWAAATAAVVLAAGFARCRNVADADLVRLTGAAGVVALLGVTATRALDAPLPSPTPLHVALWMGGAMLVVATGAAAAVAPIGRPAPGAMSRSLAAVPLGVALTAVVVLGVGVASTWRDDGSIGTACLTWIVALVAAAWPWAAGRRVVVLVALPASAAVAVVASALPALTPEVTLPSTRGDAVGWITPLVVATCALVVAVRPDVERLRGVRATALAVLPPLVARTIDAALPTTGGRFDEAFPALVAFVAVAVGLVLRRRTLTGGQRTALDAAAIGTAAAAVVLHPFDPLPWVGLALVALTASFAPEAADPTTGPRRLLRQIATPILAAGLAWLVVDDRPDISGDLPALTAAGVLVAVGTVTAILRVRAGGAPSREARVWLVFGGFVGLTCIVLRSFLVRETSAVTITIAVVAALIVLGQARGFRNAAVLPYGDALALPAGLALVLVPPATVSVPGLGADLVGLAWGLPVVAVFAVAAVLTRRTGAAPGTGPALMAASAAVATAVATAATSMVGADFGLASKVASTSIVIPVWLCVLGALAVGGRLRPLSGIGGAAPWVACGGAVVVGAVAVGFGYADPIERVTVPLGAIALAMGVIELVRTTSRSSWPLLGPGLALLLLPTLLVEYEEPTGWRLVGLGVASVAALLWGAFRSLQAPLVGGAVIAVAHALTSFWPLVTQVYDAVPWWVWLAIAGLILVFVASTYEARVRDTKRVIGAYRSLR